MYLANEESSLAIFSTHLGHIFGGDVRNDSEILMRGKEPHEPTFADDIVRIHSLMIYTDIVEYNIVGDTKAPLLRCFPFTSKLKSGGILTTGQYMNYQTFSIFEKCGKEFLRCITLPLNKLLTVYLCSSIGTWDRFPQTLFQTLRMTRLRLSTHSLATRQESIG